MNATLSFVPVGFPSLDSPSNFGWIVDAAVETLTMHDAQLRFRHVEPTSVFGRRVEFQPVQKSPCFFGRKCFVQTRPIVSVQIVLHEDDLLGVGIMDVAEFLDAQGPILASSPFGHPD
jgi:hypothetical protein